MASSSAVSKTHSGSQLLAEAVDRGDVPRIKALLLAGADPNDRTQVGLTALMRAIMNGHKDIAALLIENGADVNARRDDGFTPLLFAAFFGQYDLVCLLLEKGADVHAQSKLETSAQMWASARGFPEIAALLRHSPPDEIPIRSARPQDDVERPVATWARTPLPQAVPESAKARYPRFKKRARIVLSSKQIGILAALALLISGVCTYYALRTSGDDPDAAVTGRQDNPAPPLATTRQSPINHQNQGPASLTNIVVEFSKSLPGSSTEKRQQQPRVPESHRNADVKLAPEPVNYRADVGRVSQLPSQDKDNDKSKHVVLDRQPAQASVKKGVADSEALALKELPEMKPAAVEVEQNPPRSSTAGESKTVENNSMQSVFSPSPTGPKQYKVIRWP
jgi:ankyrin repeat protein